MHTDSERKSTTLLLLRHGQTDYPKDRFYDDALEDPALNPLGRNQAGAWTSFLEKYEQAIAGIYVSPSRRTQETAQIATEKLEAQRVTMEALQEWRFGRWGGLSSKEVKMKYPAEWAAWRKDMAHFTPEGAESLKVFSRRVNEGIATLVSKHIGETVLVVTHAGSIRMIVAHALEMPLIHFKRLVIRHASITKIEYTDRWPNLHAFSFYPKDCT